MQSLYGVLAQGTRDFVHLLVDLPGLSHERAERFVELAGTDLIESIEWRRRDLRGRSLSAPGTVRDLLSVIRARRLAAALDMPQAEVWAALRAFVPRFLEMAEGMRAQPC